MSWWDIILFTCVAAADHVNDIGPKAQTGLILPLHLNVNQGHVLTFLNVFIDFRT
jgi:hypothetical protein